MKKYIVEGRNMSKVVEAVYENGVLKLTKPIKL